MKEGLQSCIKLLRYGKGLRIDNIPVKKWRTDALTEPSLEV